MMALVSVMVVMTAVVVVVMIIVMMMTMMMTVMVCIGIRPLGFVRVVVFRMNRDAQAVQPRPRRGLGMEMQMLREKGIDGFLNRRDVHAQRGKRRKNHVTARTADTIEPNVFFHECSISYGRYDRNRISASRRFSCCPKTALSFILNPCYLCVLRAFV